METFCRRNYLANNKMVLKIFIELSKNLEEIMAERGVEVDHTTIMRWVHQYSPELERRSESI